MDSSKNQLASADADSFGEAENGAQALAAQGIQSREIEDDGSGTRTEKIIAVDFKQMRRGAVEATGDGNHLGIPPFFISKFKHGSLLSPHHFNYPPSRGKPQPADG